MAYNPFNIFRRNQKAIFAVITVFIMFTFVLSSGLGGGADFFDWLPQWLGKKSRKGDVVCKIDGDKIYDGELSQIRRSRVIANRFMIYSFDQSFQAIQQFADQQMKQFGQLSPEARQALQRGTIREFLQDPNARAADKEFFRTLEHQQIMMNIQRRLSQERNDTGVDHYFVNLPNAGNRDTVEFLLWQKKADQLGIRFNEAEVRKLIEVEFYGLYSPAASRLVHQQMRNAFSGFDLDSCLRAIGEEFRVRLAQTLVLGPPPPTQTKPPGPTSPLFTAPPLFATGYDVYDEYRDQYSPTFYRAIPVPAAGFMHRVPNPEKADEKELQQLYDKHKDDEPNPGRETPGFKEPRKVKVQWVSATGTEPYYTSLAEAQLKTGEVAAKAGALLTLPLGGVGPAWAGPAVALLATPEPLLVSEYESVVGQHTQDLKIYWSGTSNVRRLLETSALRRTNLAAAAGGVAGSIATHAGPLPGLTLASSAAAAFETRDRTKAGMAVFLGSVPGPGLMATAVGGEVAFRTALPKPPPVEAFRPDLLKTLAAKRAMVLMREDMRKFSAEVKKLSEDGKAKDKGPVTKYIAETVASRGWKTGASEVLRDEWTLEDDPGLAPLRASLPADVHGGLRTPPKFGERFFWTPSPIPGGTRSAAAGTYKPEFYPNEPKDDDTRSPFALPTARFLAWRTEEANPAKLTYDQAREAVKAAWKRVRARDEAKKRADEIADAVRKGSGDDVGSIDFLLRELAGRLRDDLGDPKARERARVVFVPGVSPLTLSFDGSPGGMPGFVARKFEFTPTTDIPYPTKDMVQKLIDERTKPPKTVHVIADEPKDTYYVFVLANRSPKSADEFKAEVFGPGALAGSGILMKYREEAFTRARDSVMGLLKKEFRYEVTDEQKKKLEKNEGGDTGA